MFSLRIMSFAVLLPLQSHHPYVLATLRFARSNGFVHLGFRFLLVVVGFFNQ